VFFLLHKDGNGGAGEFGGEERTHFMVHVEFLAVELFDGVGYGGDFDLAEAFDEGSVAGGWARSAAKRAIARRIRQLRFSSGSAYNIFYLKCLYVFQ